MEQIEGYTTSPGLTVQEALGALWRRKWIALAVFLVTMIIGFRFVQNRKNVWTATAQMLVTANGVSQSTTTEGDLNGNSSMMESPQTQINMILTDEMAQQTYNRIKNNAEAQHIPSSDVGVTNFADFRSTFLGSVKAINPTDTALIEISVTTNTPTNAQLWADSVCEAFVDWKKSLAGTTVKGMAADLKLKVASAEKQLSEAEQKEREYKESHNVVDIKAQTSDLLNQLTAHTSELQTTQQELRQQEENLAGITSRLAFDDSRLKVGAPLRIDTEVQNLEQHLHDLNGNLFDMGNKYREEAVPQLFAPIKKDIADTERKLELAKKQTVNHVSVSLPEEHELTDQKQAAERQVAIYKVRIGTINSQIAEVQNKLTNVPKEEQDFIRLERAVQIAQAGYNDLQLKLNKATVDLDTAKGNVIITQKAYVPLFPSNLPAGRILLVSALFGIILAIGFSLLFDRGDNRIRNSEQVRAIVGGPIVGTLPKLTYPQMRKMVHGETPPLAAEAYSLACANLMLALRHAWQDDTWHKQLVLITSAVPNEGKSLTAAEVARFMARSGKRVILVDADMRRPTQKRLFDIDRPIGFSDVLAGDLSIQEVLVDTNEPNLQLLPSGVIKKNPTQLISSNGLVPAMSQLREAADVVIIDAPACAIVADAMLIAPHVDCIIQVVGAGVVPEKLVRETTEALRAAAPRIMAFIVNRAPNDRSRVYTPYYFKDYRVRHGNGNGHSAETDITYALPSSTDPEETHETPEHS